MTTLAEAWAQGWCEGVKAGWASTGTTPPDSWTGENPHDPAPASSPAAPDEGLPPGYSSPLAYLIHNSTGLSLGPAERLARAVLAAGYRKVVD